MQKMKKGAQGRRTSIKTGNRAEENVKSKQMVWKERKYMER